MTTTTATERPTEQVTAAAVMTPGREWIYRAQDDGPSRRVRIVGERRTARTVQMEIEHLDGARAGQRQVVGLRRLKGPWEEVAAIDALDAKRRELVASRRFRRPEDTAALVALARVMPHGVIDLPEWPGGSVVIRDPDAVASRCRVPLADLMPESDSLGTEDGLLVSADVLVRIAQAACAAHPGTMHTELLSRERRLLIDPRSRELRTQEPAGPVTAILHEWCGTEPLELRLRLAALENALAWQRALVTSAAEALRRCDLGTVADNLERLSQRGDDDYDSPDVPFEHLFQ